jgi:hypothetical protein
MIASAVGPDIRDADVISEYASDSYSGYLLNRALAR